MYYPPVKILHQASLDGAYRTSLPVISLILRGFLAGAYIGMGAVLMIVCSSGVSGTLGEGFARLVGGAVFPVGLIMVVLTGAELFSGDAMLAPLAAWFGRGSWLSVLRLWFLVYLGNILGAVFFALLAVYALFLTVGVSGQVVVTGFGPDLVSFAAERCNYPGVAGFISCLLRSVICGWILNLAILLGICADDVIGKIAGVWFPSLALIATGSEHAVTDLCLIPAGLLTAPHLSLIQIAEIGPGIAALGWMPMISTLVLVTIGNLIGGLLFAGLLFWISFRNEIESG